MREKSFQISKNEFQKTSFGESLNNVADNLDTYKSKYCVQKDAFIYKTQKYYSFFCAY